MEDERTTNPNKTVVTVITKPSEQGREGDSREGCLVIIYGDDLGRRVPLGSEPTVIGRSSKCDVQLDQESVSRNHARIQRQRNHYVIRDLGSTNGTYVNDELVDEVVLRDGDQLKIGRTIFKFIVSGNMEAQYHEEIYRLMTVDGLTELHNKRYFNEAIEREASRSRRYERAFSLVLFDIDHFKRINDQYGHLAGDHVLRELARVVQERIRRDEIFARWGGEEFALILPETPLEGAYQLGEDLRARIEAHRFVFQGEHIPVTISGGAALLGEDDSSADLIKAADAKLYEAKRSGRNRICI